MKTKTTKTKTLPKKRKLTRKQMAVAIAKDVILQIKAKRFRPESGVYVSGIDLPEPNGKQLQPLLQKRGLKCDVCAIGAAFLSSVRLFNDFEIPEYFDDCDMRPKLGEFFSQIELRAIESSFENWHDSLFLDTPLHDLGDKGRMLFIMSEVVRQKGRFNPKRSIKEASKL